MDDAGVIDAGVEEVAEGVEQVEDGLEAEESAESAEGKESGEDNADVDGRKHDKEYRTALKQLQAHPELGKFAKTAYNDHARMLELGRVEPGGISAVREKYAAMEAIGGVEGLTTLQERIAATDEVDQMLAAGNPKALDALGEEFNGGLAKLAPTILDRVMKADPAAYNAAILPHLMSAIGNSDLYRALVRMEETFEDSRFDEKTKMQVAGETLKQCQAFFAANQKKAGDLKNVPVDQERSKFDQERSEFEQQKQTAHWSDKIVPNVLKAEEDKFKELLKPYAKRLNLTPAQEKAALSDFRSKLKADCNKDTEFLRQRGLYQKQSFPDPDKVANWAKVNLTKKAQGAFDAVKAERWDSFLAGKPKPAVVPAAKAAPVTKGNSTIAPSVVSVKPRPEDINYRGMNDDDIWNKRYLLKTGKWVQVRTN